MLALGRGRRLRRSTRAGACARSGPARDGDLSPHGTNAVLASGSALVAVHVADGRCAGACLRPAPSRCRAGRASARCRRAAAWRTSPAARSTSSAATGKRRAPRGAARARRRAGLAPARRRHTSSRSPPPAASASSAADSRRADRRAARRRARRSRSAGAPTAASLAVLDADRRRRSTAPPASACERVAVRGGTRARRRLRAGGQPPRRAAARHERPHSACSCAERAARSAPCATWRSRPSATAPLARRPQRADREPRGRRVDRDPPARRPPAAPARRRPAAARRLRAARARLGRLSGRISSAQRPARRRARSASRAGRSTSNSLSPRRSTRRAERLQERVGRLEEVDRPPCGSASARRAAGAARARRGGALAADGRAVADRQEEDVDLADRRLLLGAQRGLAEVAEVAEAQAVEREAEDRVRDRAACPRRHRARRRRRRPRRAASRACRRSSAAIGGEPRTTSTPLWSRVLVRDEQEIGRRPSRSAGSRSAGRARRGPRSAPNGSMKTLCSPLIRNADWPYQRMRMRCLLGSYHVSRRAPRRPARLLRAAPGRRSSCSSRERRLGLRRGRLGAQAVEQPVQVPRARRSGRPRPWRRSAARTTRTAARGRRSAKSARRLPCARARSSICSNRPRISRPRAARPGPVPGGERRKHVLEHAVAGLDLERLSRKPTNASQPSGSAAAASAIATNSPMRRSKTASTSASRVAKWR